MTDTVENLTISCIDFRFRARVADWIKTELDDQSDLVTLAGASKAILDEDTRESAIKQVEIARGLHQISAVHLLDHTDCAAYGGSAAFAGDSSAEVQMHHEKLQEAASVLRQRVPEVQVKLYLLELDGTLHRLG